MKNTELSQKVISQDKIIKALKNELFVAQDIRDRLSNFEIVTSQSLKGCARLSTSHKAIIKTVLQEDIYSGINFNEAVQILYRAAIATNLAFICSQIKIDPGLAYDFITEDAIVPVLAKLRNDFATVSKAMFPVATKSGRVMYLQASVELAFQAGDLKSALKAIEMMQNIDEPRSLPTEGDGTILNLVQAFVKIDKDGSWLNKREAINNAQKALPDRD
jgi:hypothetical protein